MFFFFFLERSSPTSLGPLPRWIFASLGSGVGWLALGFMVVWRFSRKKRWLEMFFFFGFFWEFVCNFWISDVFGACSENMFFFGGGRGVLQEGKHILRLHSFWEVYQPYILAC